MRKGIDKPLWVTIHPNKNDVTVTLVYDEKGVDGYTREEGDGWVEPSIEAALEKTALLVREYW